MRANNRGRKRQDVVPEVEPQPQHKVHEAGDLPVHLEAGQAEVRERVEQNEERLRLGVQFHAARDGQQEHGEAGDDRQPGSAQGEAVYEVAAEAAADEPHKGAVEVAVGVCVS